ncbi:hypothetical protein F4805DRAFT_423363 [Annulohypoxylon moriforme]|nr:hypothetical protein F4805DRAFT_423363 [Annulohypoxylon moriforme]
MGIQDDGAKAVTAMWALTAMSFIFVVLRAYTRLVVVKAYGIDDHVYNLAFIFLMLYSVFVTISAQYGFGRNMWEIKSEYDTSQAILFEGIGQTFAVLGMAIAKWSLGLFLLRIVDKMRYTVSIWMAMAILMASSISVCFVFWLQCTPPAYLWDRQIPGGYCAVNAAPASTLLSVVCVLVDFFFAILPWAFIWKLQMNRREKFVILVSMSLGIIAGTCGIKRSFQVSALSSSNYLKDTVGLIVWSAAEIAVTMVCIGIAVCRPLYKNFLGKLTSQGSKGYQKQNNEPPLVLHTIGGGVRILPGDGKGGTPVTPMGRSLGRTNELDITSHTTSVSRTRTYERSDEEFLLESHSSEQQNPNSSAGDKGIKVINEVHVTRS